MFSHYLVAVAILLITFSQPCRSETDDANSPPVNGLRSEILKKLGDEAEELRTITEQRCSRARDSQGTWGGYCKYVIAGAAVGSVLQAFGTICLSAALAAHPPVADPEGRGSVILGGFFFAVVAPIIGVFIAIAEGRYLYKARARAAAELEFKEVGELAIRVSEVGRAYFNQTKELDSQSWTAIETLLKRLPALTRSLRGVPNAYKQVLSMWSSLTAAARMYDKAKSEVRELNTPELLAMDELSRTIEQLAPRESLGARFFPSSNSLQPSYQEIPAYP